MFLAGNFKTAMACHLHPVEDDFNNSSDPYIFGLKLAI